MTKRYTLDSLSHPEGGDLIFIASHGRRGLSRLLAGSVTQSVLATAPIPVMVLRPPAFAGVA